ncbi:TIGR03617 family F420-dependent LLM class oxidoreductase [Yinghuangia seranimata]|uniref:TIGR03617 family F420-dependent LLM class oxidoreductase n=1 Tax=Yinghuangia seranimata TaxID=408067 RepID=UPI00248B5DBB|nr:TIGR03617 family F420-dependent LLM class oxidoreductase [Yinghuangia seranimata]MDI2131166.1 TIGR03617 family F420-dependent LLM class oxidoreductase [Yinghuangia seranimata]
MFQVYTGMDPRLPLRAVPAHARRAEAAGYDGLQVAETVHDALAVALLALEHTERITVRTSVALAFVRAPLLTAYSAWDLSAFSGGRFQLGLGTQIRQNIQDRYGMPWSEPAARMRDYIGALRTAFATFRTGERPAYEGDHYRMTRMQPYFNPGPDPDTAEPRIYLGGVNRAMCELAGELADGFVTHPTNSDPRYLERICRPGLAAGAARAGRSADALELVAGTQLVVGATRADLDRERERQRRLFAFLYSTPAYRRTLELYGWADLQEKLAALIRDDQWDRLAALVTDDVLETLVPMGTYAELPGLVRDRWGGLAGSVTIPLPADPAHDPLVAEAVAELRG